jgi:transcriptional regulator with XRE-family HTH domain
MRKNRFTNRYLASKLNLSPTMIQKYRVGESSPRPENIIKLAKVLNVTVDYLPTGDFLGELSSKKRKYIGRISFEEIL